MVLPTLDWESMLWQLATGCFGKEGYNQATYLLLSLLAAASSQGVCFQKQFLIWQADAA